MYSQKTSWLVKNAIVAAIYVVMTLALSPLSYGMMQIRFSEMLMLLPFYDKRFTAGLVIGVLVSNLGSPLGVYDIAIGTLSTLICILVYRVINNVWLAMLSTSIIGSAIVGTMLILLLNTPIVLTYVGVAVGEMISLVLGILLFNELCKNRKFNHVVFNQDARNRKELVKR